jgi:small redox-active disulfide protein 2
MDICVLGTGCIKCETLEKLVRTIASELGIDCTIEKVSDIEKILGFGVMMTPALVIDGDVVFSGAVPSEEEVRLKLSEKI